MNMGLFLPLYCYECSGTATPRNIECLRQLGWWQHCRLPLASCVHQWNLMLTVPAMVDQRTESQTCVSAPSFVLADNLGTAPDCNSCTTQHLSCMQQLSLSVALISALLLTATVAQHNILVACNNLSLSVALNSALLLTATDAQYNMWVACNNLSLSLDLISALLLTATVAQHNTLDACNNLSLSVALISALLLTATDACNNTLDACNNLVFHLVAWDISYVFQR